MKNQQASLPVMVESAVSLSETEKTQLETVIKELSKEPVSISYVVVPKLIGGFTIKLGDKKIDASLVRQLTQLTRELKGVSHG